MTRRQLLQLGLTASATSVYAGVVEPRWFDVSHTVIPVKGLLRPIRVAHLADLHSSPSVPSGLLQDAARLALAQRPDLVLLTGDYISHTHTFDSRGLEQVFRRLSGDAPVFAVMGNHDGGSYAFDGQPSVLARPYLVLAAQGARGTGEWFKSSGPVREILLRGGVRVLHNESVLWQGGGQTLQLAGVGDFWVRGEFHPELAFQGAHSNLPTVVLSHNPDSKVLLRPFAWDLMLCGHTHGGQVVPPFVHPHWMPVQDKRYVAGLYEWERRQLYITRGVGSPFYRGFAVRFACRPEISILELVPPFELS
jgi:predicted MPP superfamily phosphohydrolase